MLDNKRYKAFVGVCGGGGGVREYIFGFELLSLGLLLQIHMFVLFCFY